MTKYTRLSVTIQLLIILAVITLTALIINPTSIMSVIALSLTLLMSLYVIYQQFHLMPLNKIRHFQRLTESINAQLSDERMPVEPDTFPEEFQPIANAVNDLLSYDTDRIHQEKMFSADASHELRTPLAGIRLQTQLAMQSKDPKQRERALKNVIKAIDRATRLVEQLLVLSRLTTKQIDPAVEAVPLDDLCAKTIAECYPEAKERTIQIKLEKENGDYSFNANEQCLLIMLQNLLRNALRFTPESGSITVKIFRKNQQIILEIIDTGPGIPEDQRDRVLQRFQKADNGGKGGTGLGLAIVKRIIDLHRGKLSLAKNPHGQGLRVIVTLPLNNSLSGNPN